MAPAAGMARSSSSLTVYFAEANGDEEGFVMDRLMRKYAGTKVPRYTSYPTVPDFQRGFAGSTYRRWLEALDPKQPVSLYLHVPFCRKMCWYCGCNMKLAKRYEPIRDYVDTLATEIELIARWLPGRLSVSHLHWGGGTPTALAADDIERVMALLAQHFELREDAELAIESDPRTLTEGMANRIGMLGFTRASFGVQAFDPKVQTAINRIQPPAMVEHAVKMLRDAGITGINFDLIYGLPYQTVASVIETIAQCRALQPDRVALFGYAHVPWIAKNQRMIPVEALPGVSARFAQAETAANALIDNGYLNIGLDHFALPHDSLAIAAGHGKLRRNFQGYTTDQAVTLLGFGATSIGRTPNGYVQNIAETRAWARAVNEGDLPVAKGHTLSDDDRLRAHLIEQIMCQGEVNVAAFAWSDDEFRNEHLRLSELADDGLLTFEAGWIRLTERGRPLARVVAAVFDSYRQHATSRHSTAV